MTPKPENTHSYNLDKGTSSAYVNKGFVNNEKAVIPTLELTDDGKHPSGPQATQQRVIDFDDLLPHIGEFGRYQKILFLLMVSRLSVFTKHSSWLSLLRSHTDSIRILRGLCVLLSNLPHTRTGAALVLSTGARAFTRRTTVSDSRRSHQLSRIPRQIFHTFTFNDFKCINTNTSIAVNCKCETWKLNTLPSNCKEFPVQPDLIRLLSDFKVRPFEWHFWPKERPWKRAKETKKNRNPECIVFPA